MIRTKRKINKQRGSRSNGGGCTKKRRGAGNKGGKGKAGMGKQHWTWTVIHDPDHFGKHGFKRPQKMIKKVNAVNLIYLEVGDDFNPFDYYLGSDSGLSPNVESDVNTDEPGVYNVRYTVGTEDACGSSFLVVVVTEQKGNLFWKIPTKRE